MHIVQAFIILTVTSVTNGLTCLSCESVAHPFLCDHTMQCLQGSICSVEKIVNSGDTTYKLGCIDITKCHSKRSSFGTDIETCRECCATDACNLRGCGKYMIDIKRGPICFDCDGISDPTKCHRVKVCETDEQCLTRETFRWNVKLFKTSCENKHICQALSGKLPVVGRRRRSISLKQKRSVLCSKCCSHDLCNTYCGSMFEFATTLLVPSESTVRETTLTSTAFTTLETTLSETTSVATTKSSSKSIAPGYNEFFIMFIENYNQTQTTPTAYIFATHPGTVNFSVSGNENQTFKLSQGKNAIEFTSSMVTTDGKENNGVKVRASIPIILYVLSKHHESHDGYLAIPSQFLSNVYIVPSFRVREHNWDFQSEIGIMSTTNTLTHVEIKLNLRNNDTFNFNSSELHYGDKLSFSLSEFDTFQISNNVDLSGSIITSSQPVGVVSGNKCTSVIGKYCNHFTEMILPTNQLDDSFIVPTVEGRNGSVVRVYCPLTTQLHIVTLNKEFYVKVQKENLYEFENSELSFVKSDTVVLMMIYPKEAEHYDSYMMTVFGIDQYKTKYNIIVPEGFTSYVSIAFKSGSTDGFQIDQNRFYPNTVFNITISGTTYTTVSYNITDGAHTITNQYNLSFGLWIYGDREDDGYGFPGGMAYTNYP